MAPKVTEGAEAIARHGHDPEAMTAIVHRLKRAEGQLHALVAAVGPEANCRDIVIQLSAVSKALDRAGFAIIANALRDCVAGGEHDDMDAHELQRLFMSLA